jgi:hypothetical protein
MAEKLKKVEKDYYTLYDSDGDIVASNNPKTPTTKKLSLKNCQAIENGYDLDELAVLSTKDETTILGNQKMAQGFIKGFQKALEVLGDKKFSEFLDKEKELGISDIKTIERIQWYYNTYFDKSQQTEWDVEIVMEKEVGTKLHDDGREFFCTDGIKPRIDVNGCLILKRI